MALPSAESASASVSVSVGSLVTLTGLTSSKGQLLNGCHAEVVAPGLDVKTGRVSVALYTGRDKEGRLRVSEDTTPFKAKIKSANLLARDPKCPLYRQYHHDRSVLAFQAQCFPDAKVHLERMVQLEPSMLDYKIQLGVVLRETGATDEAVQLFESVMKTMERSFPRRNLVLYDYASCLHKSGNLAEAMKQTLEIDVESTSNPDPYHVKIKWEMLNMIGDGARRMQNVSIEVKALRALITLNPNHCKSMWNLGAALCRKNEVEEGAAWYRKALEKDSGQLTKKERNNIHKSLQLAEYQLQNGLKLHNEDGKQMAFVSTDRSQVLTLNSDDFDVKQMGSAQDAQDSLVIAKSTNENGSTATLTSINLPPAPK
eukprot:CAMPEP_0185261594 /NCGR_PEP_ID=MMETSP1359-20130426/9945_1 /TAXON_ID=552665 /ORGANISM="Bigelowiella longifila, Strain CCMP242" /LENGTH=370 /DNA_ID=CAMNT_0027848263 /DNA_START=49 /DNA_END=1161 /DNA_ORIENTATION=-